MIVRAQLFASFREAAGRRQVEVELGGEGEPRVSDLVSAIGRQYPQLGPALQNAMVAVNLEYVGPDFRLQADDEVALIPPVSGGAGCAGAGVVGGAE